MEVMDFMPLRWLAPEVRERILMQGKTTQISKAENIWSLGITLWEVGTFAARRPFEAISDHQFLRAGLINPGPPLDPIDIKVRYWSLSAFQVLLTHYLLREWKAKPFCLSLICAWSEIQVSVSHVIAYLAISMTSMSAALLLWDFRRMKHQNFLSDSYCFFTPLSIFHPCIAWKNKYPLQNCKLNNDF